MSPDQQQHREEASRTRLAFRLLWSWRRVSYVCDLCGLTRRSFRHQEQCPCGWRVVWGFTDRETAHQCSRQVILSRMAAASGGLGTDIEAKDEGSIIVLYGETERGTAWLLEHLPEDCLRWARGFVVERRFVDEILAGAQGDGLQVMES